MKLPKRFNRAEQHLFAKQTTRLQFKSRYSGLSAEGWKVKNVGQSEFQASATTLK